ncbi:MAG TPA: SDR family NAD(P)-dependent oxidoreductase [Thermoplasmata archaeon]|nr:SDR family NAD(P)-dependent oxidoreductase [Thermoplasmata archaeon]
MTTKVWFITGTSRGFGRVWAEAALARGDKVAATARAPESVAPLVARYGASVMPIRLDVTNKAEVDRAVHAAQEAFGRLDVVVNNAGYGLFGAVEEVGEAEARAELETNFFGALWVTQAALPYLREQRSGHFVQVSSVGGVLANANLGLYHASKWALEAMAQSLAVEVREFGIKVTIVEPAGYATDWSQSSAVRASPKAAYAPMREARARALKSRPPPGDPTATAGALLKVVDADEPPLRIFLGDVLDAVRSEYTQRLAVWERWNPVSLAAYRPGRS